MRRSSSRSAPTCSAFAARCAGEGCVLSPSIRSPARRSGRSSRNRRALCRRRTWPTSPRKRYTRNSARVCATTEPLAMAEQRLKGAELKSAPDAAKAFDRIFVHDLVLDVEIGVYTNEKGVTQRVRFSVDVDLRPSTVALEDDIGRAFDYDTIIKSIKSIIARGHINLVETLAEEVAHQCLAHPRAVFVTVRIEKLDKEPGAVGIEIMRSKARA